MHDTAYTLEGLLEKNVIENDEGNGDAN